MSWSVVNTFRLVEQDLQCGLTNMLFFPVTGCVLIKGCTFATGSLLTIPPLARLEAASS